MFRTNDLEQLMQKVDNNGWGMIALEPDLLEKLKARFAEIEIQGLLNPASITQKSTQATIRNDSTYWLENSHPTESLLFDELNQLMQSLKNYFRLSLSNFECHFALYPQGHFYKKHVDQTAENNKRFFSFVIYLNTEWTEKDGGRLIGYQAESPMFEVLPLSGRMTVFRSDIPHEVEIAYKPRRSLAGWFRV